MEELYEQEQQAATTTTTHAARNSNECNGKEKTACKQINPCTKFMSDKYGKYYILYKYRIRA